MFTVWSAEEEPGLTQAIITIFELPSFKKESLSTIVSLEALNGTWELFISIALIHSFSASRLLLISAPSILLYLLLLCVSYALSEPAKSTSKNLPKVLLLLSLILI